MKVFNKVLEATKIEPIIIEQSLGKGKVIGFRGVRDGVGTTSLLSHVASELDNEDIKVCVLDLDFQAPNPLMSSVKTQSILKRLNHAGEPLSNIINKAVCNNSICYVGPSLKESVIDYLPVHMDSIYIEQRNDILKSLIDELSERFDVILVDIPSDLRMAESVLSLTLCDLVITVTLCDSACVTKLQRDNAILFNIVKKSSYTDLVQVDNMFELDIDFKEYGDFNKIAKIATSGNIAENMLRGKIGVASKCENIKDYNERIYYTGVMNIVNYLKER